MVHLKRASTHSNHVDYYAGDMTFGSKYQAVPLEIGFAEYLVGIFKTPNNRIELEEVDAPAISQSKANNRDVRDVSVSAGQA